MSKIDANGIVAIGAAVWTTFLLYHGRFYTRAGTLIDEQRRPVAFWLSMILAMGACSVMIGVALAKWIWGGGAS